MADECYFATIDGQPVRLEAAASITAPATNQPAGAYQENAMTTFRIELANGSIHYVTAGSAKSAKSKLSTRFPSQAVVSCKQCHE